jgi:hypothetical protein
MEKREELYWNEKWEMRNEKFKWDNLIFNTSNLTFPIDLYYPWALVFTWRLCDTSAIENPSRWFYATDDICPRTCNRYDINYKVKTVWYNLIQRWNAWYRSELNLDYLPDDFVKNENNRIIFSPFISV